MEKRASRRKRRAFCWFVLLPSLSILLLLCFSVAWAQKVEQWRGSLDLHQGDQGTLEFTRTGKAIRGRTVVKRGSNTFEHKITGSWRGRIIQFRRELSATSHQPFLGIAVTDDDGKVKMGGRFAFKYAGVWSAECEKLAKASSPQTHSTGLLNIAQSWAADLDEGKLGGGSEADIWFQAETATERYLTPLNGAKVAVAGNSSVGRNGCAATSLAASRIPMSTLAVGTYVCVLTSEGRYAQFRINAPVRPSPGTLKIGYTTWEATP
jgi:hypothetical protein